MQSAGEKQQFTWRNKMVDDLVSSLENFNTLMEFKDKHFNGER